MSEASLDAWVAETKEGHRFPAAYLPAFCRVTGSMEPLRVLTEAAGGYVVDHATLLLAQRTKIERTIQAAKRAAKAIDAALPEVDL